MNTNSQHDFHPDAESLSAFAEQALGARERGEVLAHLAVCGRCRQVVALAREAALEAIIDADAAQPLAAARRAAVWPDAWWRSWRFAWIPAAALAATVALAVFVHVRHGLQSAEVAKAVPQSVTQNLTMASNLPQQGAQQERAEAAPPAAPESIRPPARSFKREAASTAPNPPSQEPIATAAMPAEAKTMNGSEFAEEIAPAGSALSPLPVVKEPALGGSTAVYRPSPSPALVEQQRQLTLKQQAEVAAAERRFAATTTAPASVHGTDGGAAGSSTEQVAVSAPPLETRSAPAARLAAKTQPHTAAIYVGAVKTIHLPSGLAAVSMAAADHRTLAIDQAGTLFLSEDSGESWEPVNRQWTGRAVKVRRQMAGSDMEAAPTKFFELLNDKGQIWLSTDGKTWIAK